MKHMLFVMSFTWQIFSEHWARLLKAFGMQECVNKELARALEGFPG